MEKSAQATQNAKDHKRRLSETICHQKGKLGGNGQILRKYSLPKLNLEEIYNLNMHITSTEIESVIKNLPAKKNL